jgi:hypothetical protein
MRRRFASPLTANGGGNFVDLNRRKVHQIFWIKQNLPRFSLSGSRHGALPRAARKTY